MFAAGIQGASATWSNRATREPVRAQPGENNGGFGIADDSTGTGTSGTANTYTQNICGRGNGAGRSSPPGLCR